MVHVLHLPREEIVMTSWQDHRDYAVSLGLRESESIRSNCPFCKGKNTYTCTKEGGTLKYNCFKLSCDVGGRYDTDMTAQELMSYFDKRIDDTQKDSDPELAILPEYIVKPRGEHQKYQRFVRNWGLALGNMLYDVKDERVVFPIYHEGYMIDAIGRAVGHKRNPKWYRYTGKASCFKIGKGDTLLIVEDVVSAIVAWQEIPNITVMAILGTSLTNQHMEAIDDYYKVIVALDPDAAYKTLQYKKEIEAWTGLPTVAYRLVDDIKYREEEDLEGIVNAVRTI